uniref:Cathepsin propeptide inhibitor domain-containing protein n=1 Tax=Lactuca sativa TaxID=4236 RepID=A0A9R1V8D8_LACSA|nr:hypothetical protein LSAT_V11C600311790 [Lactuca sativa]
MMKVWFLFMFTMAAVMGHGHGGDRAEDPPFPGGRGPDQHEQDVEERARRKVRGKAKNIKFEKAILQNQGKPIGMQYDRDIKFNLFDLNQMYQDAQANLLTEGFQVALLKGYRERKVDAKEYFKMNLKRVETFRKAHTDKNGVFITAESEQQYVSI